MKNTVLQWIENGCVYQTGLNILSGTGRHKQLIKVITNRQHRYSSKLLYELCKEAGIPFASYADACLLNKPNPGQADDKDGQNGHSTTSPDDSTGTGFQDIPSFLRTQSEDQFNELPENIQRIIKEHSKLFMLRSQLHEQMANLPEDNQPGTVKQRKNLSDSIALLSPRIDLLFQAKEDFYLKSLKPNMEVLFPPVTPVSTEPKEKPLPDSAKELKKLKKNLQSANVKDQNMLDYQDEKKGTKPTPMPTGPKRIKLENRVKDRLQQIEAIDYKLLSVNE